VLKLDVAGACVSLSWALLFKVLQKVGFGPTLRELVVILLSMVSTQVMFNGNPGPSIWHQQGLRLGGPFSPMLFVLFFNSQQVLG
jgi:hypothetical protein